MNVVTGKVLESAEGPSSLQQFSIVLCAIEGGDCPRSFGKRSLIKSATFGLKRGLGGKIDPGNGGGVGVGVMGEGSKECGTRTRRKLTFTSRTRGKETGWGLVIQSQVPQPPLSKVDFASGGRRCSDTGGPLEASVKSSWVVGNFSVSKVLSLQAQGLSLSLSPHMKSQAWWFVLELPAVGWGSLVDSWDLLASQPSLIIKDTLS